ncbi:MAG: Bug family tripartite tricarboxylate transporter substrate binding protein [Burkholderiaceae bacterium]
MKRTLVVTLSLLCAGLTALNPAKAQSDPAQNYPDKPVRIIVPFPVGGSMDSLARQLAQQLSERWAHPVVVDNRAGASGMIGLSAVAKSVPDGYTLGVVANSFVANPLLRNDIPYDTFTSFTPVSLLATVPYVVTASASLPVKSIRDLATYAREKPDGVNYSSGGNGTMSHLGGEMLKGAISMDATHVPYRGQAPALADVVSGHVAFTLGNLPEVIPLVQAGKVNALALLAANRSSQLPNIPTLAESGHTPLAIGSWYGLVSAHGTPAPIVTKIQTAIAQAFQQPQFRAALEQQGFEVIGNTPAQFESFMRQEFDVYKKVIESAGIKSQ